MEIVLKPRVHLSRYTKVRMEIDDQAELCDPQYLRLHQEVQAGAMAAILWDTVLQKRFHTACCSMGSSVCHFGSGGKKN